MNKKYFKNSSLELKPYSTKQLTKIYGVGKKTMNKWFLSIVDETGPRVGYTYNTDQVHVIFERFGIPENYLIAYSV